MSNFLSTDPHNILKTVSKFKDDLDTIPSQYVKDSLLCTSKKIIFLKILYEKSLMENRHLLSMVYDFLGCISTIKNNEYRYFYFNIRSCIENSIRFFLNKDNDDEIGVTRMFTEFKELYKGMPEVSSIARVYSDACNYVHNNIKADIDVSRSYKYIDGSKEFNEKKSKQLCKDLLSVHSSLNGLLIVNNSEDIKYSFLYLNENIKYLINKSFLEKLYSSETAL
ncbi:TPA: hypothetical protein ACRRXZ_001498 [Morganella morganii]